MHSKFITKLETDLLPVLADIEERGLIMDTAKMRQIINDMEQGRDLAESKTYELLGTTEKINLNSSADLAELLSKSQIEGLHLPTTKSGKISTAKGVLERIDHSAMEHIIKYRSLTKLIASLRSYYNAVDLIDARLFYKFTNDCASGRLYTKDMSIQNLPQQGRYAIIPEEGKVFISADYDSFELHILSALSGDQYFRQAWQHGVDLHKQVVSDMKGVVYEKVTGALRKLGKVLNFGIAYGQEARGVANSLRISTSEARKLMDDYESKIPEIMKFKELCVKKATEQGYIETYFGRRRYLPDIHSKDRYKQLKAQRQAVNTPIQGTGADIAKISMLKLHQEGFQIDAMLHDGFLISVSDG